MSLSGALKAKSIDAITPFGDGWNRHIEIEVQDMEIKESFAVEDVIAEYELSEILDAMDEDDVISWIESQGYTVTSD